MAIIYREEIALTLYEFIENNRLTLEIVKKKDTYCVDLLYAALSCGKDYLTVYSEHKNLSEALRQICQIISNTTLYSNPPCSMSSLIEVPTLYVGDVNRYLPLQDAFTKPCLPT